MDTTITILISHDSRDENIAFEIKSFLESIFLNANFYVSGRDLIGGQVWVEQIKNHLRSSPVIVSLITKKSLNNNWLYFESGAGFANDKCIPLITDNLKLTDLMPPLSLLQARVVSETGILELVKDISGKLRVREPNNYPNIKLLVNKIEKHLKVASVLRLKELVEKNNTVSNYAKQWVYKDTCLVYDYFIQKKYQISLDIYFNINEIEIQLFGREGSEDYANTMFKESNLLPKPYDEYEKRNNRLVFKKFDGNENVEVIAECLIDILKRIETYKVNIS